MNNLKSIKYKKPTYIKNRTKDNSEKYNCILILSIIVILINMLLLFNIIKNIIILNYKNEEILNLTTEVEYLKNKTYQQIELIDALKQTIDM